MKVTHEVFFSAESKSQLGDNQLADFASLWSLDQNWFEEPNTRGQGFSGVMISTLECKGDRSRRVFVKKQEDHTTRSLAHPIKGIPTFEREYTNIVSLSALGVPTIELLYFGTAEHHGKQRAILVSYALDEFTPLDEWFQQSRPGVSETVAQAVIRAVVAAIRSIHEAGYRHGCLYSKHIFIRLPEDVVSGHDVVQVRMLDFEKAHKSPFRRRAILKDLSQFIRHGEHLTGADLDYFVSQYLDGSDGRVSKRLLECEVERKRTDS
jgi:hypothetical protein